MHGMSHPSSFRKRLLSIVCILMIFLSGCLGPNEENQEQNSQDGEISLTLWHTFAAESKEEEVFMNSIKSFESAHPNVTVDVTMVPFGKRGSIVHDRCSRRTSPRFDASFERSVGSNWRSSCRRLSPFGRFTATPHSTRSSSIRRSCSSSNALRRCLVRRTCKSGLSFLNLQQSLVRCTRT